MRERYGHPLILVLGMLALILYILSMIGIHINVG